VKQVAQTILVVPLNFPLAEIRPQIDFPRMEMTLIESPVRLIASTQGKTREIDILRVADRCCGCLGGSRPL
jgi:hypothetical protein